MLVKRQVHANRRASSARAQVYAMLRDEIVSLRLAPGARLSEETLATTLGVSRTPVREALLQLADEGLADVVPQVGTFVARISVAAVREAQFVREAIECAALRAAAARTGADGIAELEENVAAQLTAVQAGDDVRFYELDEAFHRALVAASGFPGAWRVTERTRLHLNRVRWLALPPVDELHRLVAQHVEVTAALRAGDLDGAEAALRGHLRLVLARLDPLRREHAELFLDDA